ncbi:MAG: hypothetical protein GY856_37000 [bacterium]|nr:hypothetical protein [bacterium]
MKYLYASAGLLLCSCGATEDAVETAKYTAEHILQHPEEFVHITSQAGSGFATGGFIGGAVAIIGSLITVYKKAKGAAVAEAIKKVNEERDGKRKTLGGDYTPS